MYRCLILLYVTLYGVTSNKRIVGGQPAVGEAFPYQISVRNNGAHICGGTIVHKEWIVTSAMCIPNSPQKEAQNFTIVAGSNSLSVGGQVYKVLDVILHENYSSTTQNDVAILRVTPVAFDAQTALIPVETKFVEGDESCFVSGWGFRDVAGSLEDQLQMIESKTVTLEDCRGKLLTHIADSEICTYTKRGEGVCIGDNGGPLTKVVNGTSRLIGVISRSFTPCAKDLPDIHSRMTSFIPWFNAKCNNCLNTT